jgi:hypothetical protein
VLLFCDAPIDYNDDESIEEFDEGATTPTRNGLERKSTPKNSTSPSKNHVRWRDEGGSRDVELEEEIRSLLAATQKYLPAN